MKPFDFVNAINSGEDIMHGELERKNYSSYLTNRNFSNFNDTVLVANEMNQHTHLDNDLQFSFYLNTVRPRKRFSKWHKPESDKDIQLISEYFGYSMEKAKQAAGVLSDDDIKSIRRKISKGGKVK